MFTTSSLSVVYQFLNLSVKGEICGGRRGACKVWGGGGEEKGNCVNVKFDNSNVRKQVGGGIVWMMGGGAGGVHIHEPSYQNEN